MDVDAHQLQRRLGEYLDCVAKGQVITVTERGRPRARLIPLSGDDLAIGIAEGWIRPPVRPRSIAPVRRFATATDVSELLDRDRGD